MQSYPLLFIPTQPLGLPCKGEGHAFSPNTPSRNRFEHASRLLDSLNTVWEANARERENQDSILLPLKQGVHIGIKGVAGRDLMTKSLDNSRAGYTLLNVRCEGEEELRTTLATVYLSDEGKDKIAQKIYQYAEESTRSGKPRNARLVDGIEEIHIAALDDFWTDAPEDIPNEIERWCEVWLKDKSDGSAFRRFIHQARILNIECNENAYIHFPEITVALAKINKQSFQRLLSHSEDVSECRLVREPAEFFTELSPHDQAEWAKQFLEKTQFNHAPSVAVCILDTGINNGHPMLAPLLRDIDMHTTDSKWGISDHSGHGTGMAGIAAYGDMAAALAAHGNIKIDHCLESCKIIPPHNDLPPLLYGLVTANAVQLAKEASPRRVRQVCMAVSTSSPFAHRGEPTSWSAAIDALAAGVGCDDKHLVIISAGNIPPDDYHRYPDANIIQSAEDPAQAWNALTIGAYTDLIRVDGVHPVAGKGELSPFSRTSCLWKPQWPAKPDVVFEGGNIASDIDGFYGSHDALSVLTTSRQISHRLFTSFYGTSAATAEAAWFAARLQTVYPDAWPETIRALIVHAAEWTPTMRQQFCGSDSKTQLTKLRRVFGYGVPSLKRALHCKNNALVLVAERELQPYFYTDDTTGRLKQGMQMHLYELPWPVETLREMGERNVTMRVTLSYFIEPGPGQRGWKDKYRYASHGLRFEVCSPHETEDDFVRRISNMTEREGDNGGLPRAGDAGIRDRWAIGKKGRSSGSIHSDFFTGMAVELAACNRVAIFPVVGWWRTRKKLQKADSIARYSLIISLHTEAQDVDMYTPVKTQIDASITTPVAIPV